MNSLRTLDAAKLESILHRIDGRGYKSYKDLEGRAFQFPRFVLYADHVQPDPFAPPSRFRVRVSQLTAKFPKDSFSSRSREVALRDLLVRAFHRAVDRTLGSRSSGKTGRIFVDTPGQEMLERSGAQVNEDWVEARFFVALPAEGRRILGREAADILVHRLPEVVEASLLFSSFDTKGFHRWVETGEDADILRTQLVELGLVAFVADHSILPRRSGIDERPMVNAVPFQSPSSLRVQVELPNTGRITGMGIPPGVTLIVGGGFHGKSTLLRALEHGVHNHLPGDGREFVVVDPTAVKIRAEDGRSVAGIDISRFIRDLPGEVDTTQFSTQNASGSTSQAANITEALEANSKLLLLDEDTSATNFMIRDRRMQALITKEHEPITPFVDQVRNLYRDLGVSTILVMGGSGDYFDVADYVIAMNRFVPNEVTQEAKRIASQYPTGRTPENTRGFTSIQRRAPLPESLDPSKGNRRVSLKARGTRALVFGADEIDLSKVEQLVEDGQVKAIGGALLYLLERHVDSKTCVLELIEEAQKALMRNGLDVFATNPYPPDLVAFRPQELAAALNRLRTLRVRISDGP